MKAWVLHKPGDIRFQEVRKPELLEQEVLISVKAAGICGSDIPRIFENGAHQMPLIPGHEFSGEVVELGEKVNQRWKGKRAAVFPLIPCRNCRPCLQSKYEMCRQYSYLGSRKDGGFAEYAAVPEWNLLELPKQVSYEEAAMMEPMAVAVHAMGQIDLRLPKTVVVYGLGTIGQLLVMFLLEGGNQTVYAVGNKEFQKRSLLAMGLPEQNYCDSRAENVKDWLMRRTNGEGTEIFFECTGRNEVVSQAFDLTAAGGEICMVGNPASDIMLKKDIYWNLLRRQISVTGSWNSSFKAEKKNDWQYALKKLAQKKINPAVLITHRFSLENLEQGLYIMNCKTEDYIKIIIAPSFTGDLSAKASHMEGETSRTALVLESHRRI